MINLSLSIRLSVGSNTDTPSGLTNGGHAHNQMPKVASEEPKMLALWKKFALHLVVVLIAHGLFQSTIYLHDILQT